MPVKLLLADDHTLLRQLLADYLRNRGEKFSIVGEAEDGPETLALLSRQRPDILLLDYKMPGTRPFLAFCKEVKRQSPSTRILMLTGYSDKEVVLEAAIGGSKGFFLKCTSFPNLVIALDTIFSGGAWVDPSLPADVSRTFLCVSGTKGASVLERLTKQEIRILYLLATGVGNKEIASNLHISQKTVKNHLSRTICRQFPTSFFKPRACSSLHTAPQS